MTKDDLVQLARGVPAVGASLRVAAVTGLTLGLVALLLAGCKERAQPAAAERQPPVAAPPARTNSLNLAMARIPAGEFVMGDNEGEADEKPAHPVRVSGFYMDTREVTQSAYEALMEKNPSKSKGVDKPVEQVDWYQATLFCNMRSLKEGRRPCYDAKTLACDFTANGYRLPTEAEWEYACRAGSRGKYSFGEEAAKLKSVAWFKDNAGQTTHPVGQKAPNAWGLYDMYGNVAEWCHDFYREDSYPKDAVSDPHGPAAGDKCVLRGGSWRTSADACRSAARSSETPRFADACFGSDACGFRCVRRGE